MFIRVEIDGESWLTDVGVGGVSLTAAIRLLDGAEQPTPHESRRVVREAGQWFHPVRFGSEWQDVCEFTLEAMPVIDRELANWFTSTHPESHFKNRLLAARALPDGGRVTLLNGDLTLRRRGDTAHHSLASAAELLDVLAQHFGLSFSRDTRFGPPGSPWPT